MAPGSVGQKVAVTGVDEPSVIEFRHSARRQIVAVVITLVIALVAVAAAGAAFNLARGRQWWDGLWMAPLYAVLVSLFDRLGRPNISGYQSRPPLAADP